MINLAIMLYKMKLRAVLNKYKNNYLSETVALFCGMVVTLLFLYIFHDFLNEHLVHISDKMTEALSKVFSLVILLVGAIYVGKKISHEKISNRSVANIILFLGDSKKTRDLYWLFFVPTIVASVYVPIWWLVLSYFITWTFIKILVVTLCMLLISFFVAYIKSMSPINKEAIRVTKVLLSAGNIRPKDAMYLWRIRQIIWRNQAARLCLLVALMFVMFIFYCGLTSKPLLFVFSSALFGGLFIGVAFSLQASFDFQSIWLEKNIGIDHDDYLNVLQKIGITLGLTIGLLASISWLSSQLIVSHILDLSTFLMTIKIGSLAFLSPWLLPYIVFQVDIHKPFIHILAMTLLSIFLGTAVSANLLSIALFPLIAYYGIKSQERRFYRA